MLDNAQPGGRSLATIDEVQRTDAPPVRPADEEASALIDTLEQTFQFRQRDVVRAYLANHPDLLNLVLEASTRVPNYLPIDRPMALAVLWDPDDEDGDGQLYAVVVTHREPEEIRPRIEQMDREWLIAAFRPAGDRFNVAVEYH